MKRLFLLVLLVLAACHPTQQKMGASAQPGAWTIPNWYIDPQNVTTCASDSNNCTSKTCGAAGIGPCRTWSQILSRLGSSPIFAINVTVDFLSAQTSRTDPVNFAATMIPPGSTAIAFTFQAELPTPCTGTLANLRAKNKSLSTTSAPLLASVSCFTAPNLLVVNTTRGSQALTAFQSSGTQYDLTQPMNTTTFLEDDTWANGDSVSVYTLANVYFGHEQMDWTGVSVSDVVIKNISMWSPDGPGVDYFVTGGTAPYSIQESTIQEGIQDNSIYGVLVFNSTVQAGFQSVGFNTGISAGAQLGGAIKWTGVNWFLGSDVEIFAAGGLEFFYGIGSLGSVYVDNASLLFVGNVEIGGTGVAIYGPGTIFAQAPGHFEYNTVNAVGTLNIAGLRLSNGTAPTQGAGCSSTNLTGGGASVTNCGITVTAAALDACPASATAFCNFAWSPMGTFIGKGNF